MRIRMMLLAGAFMAAWCAARAELVGVTLGKDLNIVPVPARAVAAQAISTNASGTVTLKRVTPLVVEWYDEAVVTNFTYRPAVSNVAYTVSNTLWQAWTTNALAAGGVASNLVGEAWGAKPTVAGWPTNALIYTSQQLGRTMSSNVTYSVVDTMDVQVERVQRMALKNVTNTLWSATLSGGFATNALKAAIFPGDVLIGEGTAFGGGSVQLLLER